VEDNATPIDPRPAKHRIEALSKGLEILGLFNETRISLKMKEISDLTGIPLPTVFRLLATLQIDGYIERRADKSYQPGVAVLTLGSAAVRSSGLVQSAEKPLRELAERTGETVNLGVLLEDRVLYVVRIRNADLLTANIQVGSTLPAVHTSMGKVLLAALGEDELANCLTPSSFREGIGPNAIPDLPRLRNQLEEIRAQGYAVQDEELSVGLRSISAPILGEGGKVIAAANIAVSSSRYTPEELRGTLLSELLATASMVSERLQ
jgi:IclR family pca regulon transcriptional regulator